MSCRELINQAPLIALFIHINRARFNTNCTDRLRSLMTTAHSYTLICACSCQCCVCNALFGVCVAYKQHCIRPHVRSSASHQNNVNIRAGRFEKVLFDSIRLTGALLIRYTSLIGHSFNTAFITNCESVKCIILRLINTFYWN